MSSVLGDVHDDDDDEDDADEDEDEGEEEETGIRTACFEITVSRNIHSSVFLSTIFL
jgi:hypothetical protein